MVQSELHGVRVEDEGIFELGPREEGSRAASYRLRPIPDMASWQEVWPTLGAVLGYIWEGSENPGFFLPGRLHCGLQCGLEREVCGSS